MSNTFTLDSLREETIKRYEPTKVELPDGSVVTLKSTLRLKKDERKAVVDAMDEIKELEDEDDLTEEWSELVCDAIEKVFRLIASNSRKLIAELDHDDPDIKATMYTSLLSRWMGETQLGEAESSPS